MKKVFFASLAMVLSLASHAEEVPMLMIKTDAEEKSIQLKDIFKVQYTETEMIIKLNDGTSKAFVIDDIKEMSFDNISETTFLKSTNDKEQNGMALFDLNGRKKHDASKKGIYIIKSGKETKKVKK